MKEALRQPGTARRGKAAEWVLAVDTTHEFGSLALLRGGELAEEVPLHSREGFGHLLYGHMDALLRRHGIVPADVQCFGAAAGPGSFTGVRIGLAALKGLAEALGRPVVGVSNLRAMAQFGSMPIRATVLDARRGEVYGAVYTGEGELAVPETVAPFPVWIEGLPGTAIEFISTDFTPFQAALAGTRFAGALVTTVPRALAAAVGRIAWEEYIAGRALDPAEVDANYVRRSDAELLWRE